MYCKNCGKEIEEGKVLCAECGVKESIEKPIEVVVESTTEEKVEEAPAVQEAKKEENAEETKQTVVEDPKSSETKSKMAAGLLGIFLGALGIHNFYLGNTGKALAQLLITVLSCSFLSPVSGIWGLIEGIMILTGSINTDANGVPLKD